MTFQFAARCSPRLQACRPISHFPKRLLTIQKISRNTELSYFITPKSGPMRPLQTLRDASSALLDDISAECRRQPHWRSAGRLLLTATETHAADDVQAATDALLNALLIEGWMDYANDKPSSAKR